MGPRLTGEILAEKWSDPQWRGDYLQLVNVATLLRYCIIPANYKIPDGMNSAIVLSEYGTRVQHVLTTKHDVPAKEARMMCLLEIAHEEPLLDLRATDLDRIVSEISTQILKGTLRYPYIYGGFLYRRAAELFPDRRAQLNHKETVTLLTETPMGVFQVGNVLVGPLGAIRSEQSRWLAPDNRIPLQHCGDFSCLRVHSTRLSTDYDAAINQHLPKMSKALDNPELVGNAWTEFTGLLVEAEDKPYDDYNLAGLPVALGDSLAEGELRALVRRAADDVENQEFGTLLDTLGYGTEGDTALASADHATLLQLAWACSDAGLLRAVDGLVAEDVITILPGEVRSPRLAGMSVGHFRLHTEIGRDGVRLAPTSGDIPILRLERLIANLYDTTLATDRDELAWQLRGVDGSSIEDRLAEFLRLHEPAEVVSTLVLARRQNLNAALRQLKIDPLGLGVDAGRPGLSDLEIVRKILWKLGFPEDRLEDVAAGFWVRHRWMKQFVRDASASSVLDIEQLRNGGTSFFVALEGALDDALSFLWFALTVDHVASAQPFTYFASEGAKAWADLDVFWKAQTGSERLQLEERRSLYPLGQSFRVLASYLKSLRATRGTRLRAAEAQPKWAGQTELRAFPFQHTVPFLDLMSTAQESILEELQHISKILADGQVHRIRNEISHYQRSSVDLAGLEQAVNAAGAALEALENLGACRIQYRASRREGDRWGRSVVVMTAANGNEVSFVLPSKYRWAGLPALGEPQYLVRGASFAPPNEVLRFRQGVDSEFSRMWGNFPLRRAIPKGRLVAEVEEASEVARSSHQVLPRSD